MHDLILERMNKYKVACSYCNSVLGNRAQAVKLLEYAEKCKAVAAEYQSTGVLKKENLAPALTPQILFGMTEADRQSRFQTMIDTLNG